MTPHTLNPYQVGGSLPPQAPSYVRRQADERLLNALRLGQFCYVFNTRQMGKSSLRVQMTQQLQPLGVSCGVIDMTAIGTQNITPEQWYGSMVGLLVRGFGLDLDLRKWWGDRPHLSLVNRFSQFLETVLLAQIQGPIVIFIDEIDSVLGLKFATDDFFALIRACYNRRAENPDYNRLTFTLFGVATPTDLIIDSTRTPFNIGRGIELRGFQPSEVGPLLPGLAQVCPDPAQALERVLAWTGGQPFLTQKLCALLLDSSGIKNTEQINAWIDQIVEDRIISHWESQDEPEHLHTIRHRLLYCPASVGRLLGTYQQILLKSPLGVELPPATDEGLPLDDSPEQQALILTGLVEKRDSVVVVKNPIYQRVFSLAWVGQQLAQLRPYSQAIQAWQLSGCADASWLLRGHALQEVLAWAQGKQLGDVDYQFLAASQDCDRREVLAQAQAERLQAVEARSQEQAANLKKQRLLLGLVTGAMVGAIALGALAYQQAQRTAVSELRAIVLSAEALYASNKWLDALLQAIKGKERLQYLRGVDPQLKTQVDAILEQVILQVQEQNRLNGHSAAVLGVDFSPDGEQIITASVDRTLKLWGRDGELLQTIEGHDSLIRIVKFSPDGELIASAGDDGSLKIWSRAGELLHSLPTHSTGIWGLDFSADSQQVIVGGADSQVQLWQRGTEELRSFQGEMTGIRAVAFSPDGQTVAAATIHNTVQLWSVAGTLRHTFSHNPAPLYAIVFSPDGELIATGGVDGVIELWTPGGELLHSWLGHGATVKELRFSPDSQRLASGSWDKTVKLWQRDGTLSQTFNGHDAAVWGIAFSPDGEAIASAGAENIAIIWQTQSEFYTPLHGLTGLTRAIAFSGDGQRIATSGTSQNVDIWQEGQLLHRIPAHDAALTNIASSPDGQFLASTSEDRTVKIWDWQGNLIRVITGHETTILGVDWHRSGDRLITSTADGQVWLWGVGGDFQARLTPPSVAVPMWNVRFSPDGEEIIAASNDSVLYAWPQITADPQPWPSHESAVWAVAFDPQGEQVASGSGDTTVKLWDRQGTLLKTLRSHQAAVWGVAFSPAGVALPGHDGILATSSIDETVKLWSPEGELLHTLRGHRSGVRAIAFHPHQPILASAGDDQVMILWNLAAILTLDPLEAACGWVGDYLRTNMAIGPDEAVLCGG